MMGVALALPLIISAVKSMQQASKTRSAASADEMPIRLLYVAIGGAAVILAFIAVNSVNTVGI